MQVRVQRASFNHSYRIASSLIHEVIDTVNENKYHLVIVTKGLTVNQSYAAKYPSEFDPDLPDANSVLASLCCVAVQYASKPSLELAELATSLAYKLTAPQYAESRLVTEVAKRLVNQWESILQGQDNMLAKVVPGSASMH